MTKAHLVCIIKVTSLKNNIICDNNQNRKKKLRYKENQALFICQQIVKRKHRVKISLIKPVRAFFALLSQNVFLNKCL